VHSALFMSFRIGLLSLVPDVIPIVVAYGLMAAAGVPLSTGTALVATVAIGISVDDTVHHLMTYARALDDYVHPSLALFATLRTAGRAIVASSIALAAGFLVMLGSGFVPLQQFGAFAALAMLLALATELFVTPALMLTIRVATVWDLVQLKIDPKRLAAAGAFAGLSEWQLRKVILMSTLRSCPAGARVAGADDPAGGMFVVVTGEVAATDETGQPAGRYGPGAALGPTDSGEARPRDFVATAASELLVFDAAALERLRRRFPFTARKLARAPYPRPSIRSPSA
jgi:hypothetical protein